jgi:signal transduction histidine kinase
MDYQQWRNIKTFIILKTKRPGWAFFIFCILQNISKAMITLPDKDQNSLIKSLLYYVIATSTIYILLLCRLVFIGKVQLLDQAFGIGVGSTILLTLLFAAYFLFKNQNIGKHYISILYGISVLMSFYYAGGLKSIFAVDLTLLLIFYTFIHQHKYLRIYLSIIVIVFAISIVYEYYNPSIISRGRFISPLADIFLELTTRLILVFILISFVKKKYSDLFLKSEEDKKAIYETNETLQKTISDLSKTQRKLIQSEKMAALGTMTAGVAHEINNPLNYANGGREIIERIDTSKLKESDKELFDDGTKMIHSGISRIDKIIKSLLTYSHKGDLKPIPVEANLLLTEAIELLNPKLKEIDLVLNLNCNKTINVHPDRIQQVFINIIDNAIFETQHSNRNKIEIETNCSSDKLQISIFNEGNPIPEESFSKLFDPFYTTKEPGKGTGLGLSIAYNIISDYNGTIEVKNLKRGVKFSIELPVIS